LKPFFDIASFHDYVSPELAAHLLEGARPVEGVPRLAQVGEGGGLESREAMAFLAALDEELRPRLASVLAQRKADRKFIDERVRATAAFNRDLGRRISDPDYATVLGLEDASGRIVFGPKRADFARAGGAKVAPLPEHLQGPHVTLFGPPDSAKLAVNAMNAYHRKLPGEPAIVEELLGTASASPFWGADDEDSKTPLRADLVDAGVNLSACFDGTIRVREGDRDYRLAADRLSLPIKRFPGLALPCAFLYRDRSPVPLHLYDFALHLFRHRADPRALTFYVPKLENEEEAAYVHAMVEAAERQLVGIDAAYRPGTVRLMIVLENPRAILRAHEIIDALHPYFAGASLGWHDYLASTARLFREDPSYRIPVKADPNIVIKYIKASHDLVAEVVGSRGGVKVGGMYGILPVAGDPRSLQVTLRGFFKDVVTQLKRGLNGFWVAHPDFVRLGLAIVEAWRRRESGDPAPYRALVEGNLEGGFAREVMAFTDGPDIRGLDLSDPGYVRSLIVADIEQSDFIANNHPDEIRYNVFQSLQYLADWLSGNGCVALPTSIDGVPVRVMDDLATAERSRWEVWAELRHGRFPIEDFVRIAHEEMNFIRRDLSDGKKIVQVKWDERTSKWYPVALRLMLQLMTAGEPPEFATELLLPFTLEEVRAAEDPWAAMREIEPMRHRLDPYVASLHLWFEVCGCARFAREMARNPVKDHGFAESLILGFSREEVIEAASFHGDIGQSARTLDATAAREQAGALSGADAVRSELVALGAKYRERFGFKFLISAAGKSAEELLAALRSRIERTPEEELDAARRELWEFSRKRIEPKSGVVMSAIDIIRLKHGIAGAQVAVSRGGHTQSLRFGDAEKGAKEVDDDTRFELASLSKTIGSAFALEYFRAKGIPVDSPVNALFARTKSAFRLRCDSAPSSADRVTIAHLMSHTALNMHYVPGLPSSAPMPPCAELLEGGHGYEAARVICEPGTSFRYSGAGFIVLEHLIESLEEKRIQDLVRPWLARVGVEGIELEQHGTESAKGYFDDGKEVPGGRLSFPAFAAGALGSARSMGRFLVRLGEAFSRLEGVPGISHDTAVEMLRAQDRGSREFMGCGMGLGVFVAEAGENRLAIHQGANEGFRALYVHCFAGPDRGKGFVILCNGDNRGVLFIAEAAQILFARLGFSGIDYHRFEAEFRFQGLAQEQIVNLGYKALLFDAFEPDLPEEIVVKGPRDPLADLNLAVGARVVSVTNQRFARAENLVSAFEPVFDPELFGRQGKIMDSWESVRHNVAGVDTLVLALPKPSGIRYASLSTKYHDGNQAVHVRLLGRAAGGEWVELLPKTRMEGHSLLRADLSGGPATGLAVAEVRVEMFPDGGLTRLGLYEDLPADLAR
jgi:malate synthase/CubicO group peptidase (beta-lactamase class C family)